MILRGQTFGRGLGHEGRTLINGISALIKETPESSLSLFYHVMIQQEEITMKQKEGPHQTRNLPAP